ncbi:MAG: PQQ-binding-like beta-propeller repeat protein [Planctomycetota bacterium]
MRRLRWLFAAIATVSLGTFEPATADEAFEEPRFLREKPGELARVGAVALSPFQPAGVTSRMRRTLLQFDALVADEAWADAIDLIERLQNEAGDELTKLPALSESALSSPDGHTLYVPLARRCQQMLATLGEEGLSRYRERVDRSARDRLNAATQSLDEEQLQEIADEFLASDSAGDALLALGELALERGDIASARRAMNRLHPLLWGPFGRPAGVTLCLLGQNASPADVAAAWRNVERPSWLGVAPADESLLPVALSRLALASIREGDLQRARAEISLLRGIAPDAVGRLAGREQPLTDTLETMIAAQQSASEQGDSPMPSYAWAWVGATEVETSQTPRVAQRVDNPFQLRVNGMNVQQFLQRQAEAQMPSQLPPNYPGVVTHGLDGFYVENNRLKRLDLATGKSEPFKLPGFEENEPDDTPRPALGDFAANGVVFGNGRAIQLAPGQGTVIRGTGPVSRIDPSLAIGNGVLYARVVRVTPSRRNVRNAPSTMEEVLIGKPIGDEEAATMRYTPPSTRPDGVPQPGVIGQRFAGPPTIRGNRLYVALQRPSTRADVSVACYSTDTGRLVWTTAVGSGESPSRVGIQGDLPVTLDGDTVYLATGLGSVASLEAKTGNLRWIATYPRDREPSLARPGQGPVTPPSVCVVAGDRLIASPADSTRLFAWDTGTGRPMWDAPLGSGASEICGVADSPDGSVVLLSGRQVAAFDTLTGEPRFQWPESRRAGLRGVGRAALVGGEFFWPTDEAIYAIDPASGGLTRPPIALAALGGNGAQVVPTEYGPLVCGPEKLRLLVAAADRDTGESTESRGNLSRLMDRPNATPPEPWTARLTSP